jgi:hypothetical protein
MRRSANVFLALVFFGILSTAADGCVLSGPRYRLVSDTVRWSLQVSDGESCIRGIRFGEATIDSLTVLSAPQNGHLTVQGPGFSYKAASDFQGRDVFSLMVSGSIRKVVGSSTIEVEVSVCNTPPPSALLTSPPLQHTSIYQEFMPWCSVRSPDGIWRINGPWKGTGSNLLDPALAQLSSTYKGESGGFLSLKVQADALRGSEIQTVTLPGYGYGYYETKMRVTPVPGVVASFFWIEAPNYGPREWDVEFLTNEAWINSSNSGKVHLYIHPSNLTYILDLPFNPSLAFHRYGFLWVPGKIMFTVDGEAAYTFADPSLSTAAKGFIMMNTWTGNPNWGGGPPNQDATTLYDWVRFYPDVTSVPN